LGIPLSSQFVAVVRKHEVRFDPLAGECPRQRQHDAFRTAARRGRHKQGDFPLRVQPAAGRVTHSSICAARCLQV
jgi:hypothetical protein